LRVNAKGKCTLTLDTPTSPEWAKQERWKELIKKICAPCKEHGVLPALSDQFLSIAKDRPLGLATQTVHRQNKECSITQMSDYKIDKWNEKMQVRSSGPSPRPLSATKARLYLSINCTSDMIRLSSR
jgi:hypothetical protein